MWRKKIPEGKRLCETLLCVVTSVASSTITSSQSSLPPDPVLLPVAPDELLTSSSSTSITAILRALWLPAVDELIGTGVSSGRLSPWNTYMTLTHVSRLPPSPQNLDQQKFYLSISFVLVTFTMSLIYVNFFIPLVPLPFLHYLIHLPLHVLLVNRSVSKILLPPLSLVVLAIPVFYFFIVIHTCCCS